ncbi:unnamed protein product [Caenorhabditis sp. 36 PRJEB53466]|nr:unnamed protein product [Caenorhabditis sp. 36 PRJEB53466]
MLPRRFAYKSKIGCFLFSAVFILFCLRPNPRIHYAKTIQFEHKPGQIGDQLFSLFSQLGVSRTIDRIPVINTVNNTRVINQLSSVISVRFPMILQQFMIVIEPQQQPNAELGLDTWCSFEDPLKKFSEYTTPNMVVRGNGFRSYKYFDHLRPEIRQWMLGNAENVEEARQLLTESLRDTFKICVHMDTKNASKSSSPTDFKFSVRELNWLLRKYLAEHDRVMLVASSENPTISRRIFNSRKFASYTFEKFYMVNTPPEVQLTFSRLYCDVVLLTVPTSSFGWWMGYLAKEENSPVYFTDPEKGSDWMAREIDPRNYFHRDGGKCETQRMTDKLLVYLIMKRHQKFEDSILDVSVNDVAEGFQEVELGEHMTAHFLEDIDIDKIQKRNDKHR